MTRVLMTPLRRLRGLRGRKNGRDVGIRGCGRNARLNILKRREEKHTQKNKRNQWCTLVRRNCSLKLRLRDEREKAGYVICGMCPVYLIVFFLSYILYVGWVFLV